MGDVIPYGRQSLDEEDIAAVAEVLRSQWLTTGPAVEAFETAFAGRVGSAYAIALSSGTAALHAAMYALGIRPGDEVVVPTLTFVATANAVVYCGATPVFADVAPDTLLVDPKDVSQRITARTRAIVAVDYAGQPCAYDTLGAIAQGAKIPLVADACHSLGAAWHGRPVGGLAGLSVFSFHPVKAITTGEGGMVTTNDRSYADRVLGFRNHGLDRDHQGRAELGTWSYHMVDLGYNYRLSDIQCALGLSQLGKLDAFIRRRGEIARAYDQAFSGLPALSPLSTAEGAHHAYHLYVVRWRLERLSCDRKRIFDELRTMGIGVNVHYRPVHLQPFYRRQFGTGEGMCPNAEGAYEEIMSLPIFPAMTGREVDRVIDAVGRVARRFVR